MIGRWVTTERHCRRMMQVLLLMIHDTVFYICLFSLPFLSKIV